MASAWNIIWLMVDRLKPKLADRRAERLEDVYRTLLEEPLQTNELDTFYESSVIQARGEDSTARLALQLRDAYRGPFFKIFFSGNTATGKSTEITRLLRMLEPSFRGVRIDVRKWVNPSNLEAHEVLLAIVFEMSTAMAEAVQEFELQAEPDPDLIERIQHWLTEAEYVHKLEDQGTIEGKWSWLSKIGFDVSVQAKSSNTFTTETREKQRRKFSDLLNLTNQFLIQCYEILGYQTHEPEWLIVVEELDKSASLPRLRELLQNEPLFRELQCHLICNIPSAARREEVGVNLPLDVQPIYDIPVVNVDHKENENGVKAVAAVLARRLDPRLFAEGELERVAIGSGGNFRTLFRLVSRAVMQARLRSADNQKIISTDVTVALNQLREEYRQRLGQSGFGADPEEITTEKKLARLEQVYNQLPGHDIKDPILDKLIAAGAVQEFNGTVRRVVHPLVVDLLGEQGKASQNENGTYAGGTR